MTERGVKIKKRLVCKFCDAEKEDFQHFLLICPEYKDERKNIIELQQPHEENTDNIIGSF